MLNHSVNLIQSYTIIPEIFSLLSGILNESLKVCSHFNSGYKETGGGDGEGTEGEGGERF